MELKFPNKGNFSPTNKRPAWRQFLASNGGVVLMWILVILCVVAALRLRSPDEESAGPAKENVFAGNKDEVVPISAEAQEDYGGSSLDSAPRWGALTPMDDEGGPIETAKTEGQGPPAAPPPAGKGMGFTLPNVDASKTAKQIVEGQKKQLPKPTGNQATAGGGASSGMSNFVSFQDRENKDREEKARLGQGGAALQPLGPGSKSGKSAEGRNKFSVIQAGSDAGVQKMSVEKDILYKIDDMVKKAGERSMETGAPAAITDKEARDLMNEIGLKMGTKDKTTSPNTTGVDR